MSKSKSKKKKGEPSVLKMTPRKFKKAKKEKTEKDGFRVPIKKFGGPAAEGEKISGVVGAPVRAAAPLDKADKVLDKKLDTSAVDKNTAPVENTDKGKDVTLPPNDKVADKVLDKIVDKALEQAPKPKPLMSGLDAAVKVLAEVGTPLNCPAIVKAAFDKGYWSSNGLTPAATMHTAIITEIKKRGDQSRFIKTGRGLFAVRAA